MHTVNRLILVVLALAFVSCGGDDKNGVKPDTSAPRVTATSPLSGAVEVPATTAVTATFSKDMNPATITTLTFGLSGNIPGTVAYASRVATFTPINPLVKGTLYSAIVTTGAKDLAGTPLAQNHIWSFTTEAIRFTDGSAYFPMADGDTWYFTGPASRKIRRVVDGDTTIAGAVCKRVLENDTTAQAWSKDTSGFYVHLLDDSMRAEPPLKIPFNISTLQTYHYNSDLYWTSNDTVWSITVSGDLRFSGYVVKDVPAGHFPAAAKFTYITDGYYEYYAKDVGLLDDGDYILDSAFVGGVWYRASGGSLPR